MAGSKPLSRALDQREYLVISRAYTDGRFKAPEQSSRSEGVFW